MARIAMINTVCSGSHGRIMGDLRRRAQAQGHEVLTCWGRGPAAGGEGLPIGGRADVLWHVALTRGLDRHALGSLRATRQFLRALDAWRPDMLHLHNLHGYYLHGPALFEYIRARGLPVLWTHHDCWALTGHCSHFERVACERWVDGCHDCPLKHEYPASYGLDASRRNWKWKRAVFAEAPSLRLVAPSRWLDGVLARSYMKDVPREVIGNGVDLALFCPDGGAGAAATRAACGVGEGEAMLLAVAAPFDERKGFSDALAVAEMLRGRARLVMVGLEARQKATLPEYITGIIRTDGPEALVALYRAADCLVNPTKEDTYPTVPMEALACGTPVAGYGAGGAAEQLEAPWGVAVATGDRAALAEAAMALAETGGALRGVCRTAAEARFDRADALGMYLERYNMMTGDGRS